MVIGDALPPSNFSSVTTGSSAFPSVQKPAVTPHGPQRWNDLPTPVKLHSHTTSSTVCWKVFQNPNIGYITYPLQTLNCSLINLLLFHRTHCLLFYEFLCGYKNEVAVTDDCLLSRLLFSPGCILEMLSAFVKHWKWENFMLTTKSDQAVFTVQLSTYIDQ